MQAVQAGFESLWLFVKKTQEKEKHFRKRSELKMKKTWKEERSMEKDRGRNNIEIKINVQI